MQIPNHQVARSIGGVERRKSVAAHGADSGRKAAQPSIQYCRHRHTDRLSHVHNVHCKVNDILIALES